MKLENEDKTLLFLNTLHKMVGHFKDALLSGKEQTITLEKYKPQFELRN